MSRLPTLGGDDNQWGSILNDFLTVEHNPDGTLKKTAAIDAKYVKPVGGIPETDLSSGVQAKLNSSGGALADGSVTNAKIATNAAIDQTKISNLTTDLSAKYVMPVNGIPEADLDTGVQAKLNATSTGNILFYSGGAWPSRPSVGGNFIWIGPSSPTDIADGDIWIDTGV